MKLVLLDSSFLMLPFETGVDIFGELGRVMSGGFELGVPQEVINELEAMAKSPGRRAIAAKSALSVIEKKSIQIIGKKKPINKSPLAEKVGNNITADAWFLGNAKAHDAVVCTADSELKARLRARGVAVIILLDKSHLGFA